MRCAAYYNEIDPFAAQWLRNLIRERLIADGEVDERDIRAVEPADLQGYRQCHFFAGIGGWSCALRLAGWPDDRPIWTGSCPCQPFSTAGRRQGTGDDRHLWPEFFRLIRERRPAAVFGEQVASKDGRTWLDLVSADLENIGYAVGSADLCAAGVGAPHIRQRLYFMAEPSDGGDTGVGLADANGSGCRELRGVEPVPAEQSAAEYDGDTHGVADSVSAGIGGRNQRGLGTDGSKVAQSQNRKGTANQPGDRSEDAGKLGYTEEYRREGLSLRADGDAPIRTSQANFWHDLEWLPCRDGKARPTQPGLLPLAHGIPGRVGRLRAYGNAIVPPLAAEFIAAAMEIIP